MSAPAGRPIFDADRPVRPAWDGTRRHQGVDITTGREHVHDAAARLLNHGGPLGLDIETSGLTPGLSRQIKCVAVGNSDEVAVMDPRDPNQANTARLLLRESRELLVHNSPFDVPLIVQAGLADIEIVERVTDTLVTARMAHPGEALTLSALIERHMGISHSATKDLATAAGFPRMGDWFLYGDIDIPLYLTSAALDVAALVPLRRYLTDTAVRLCSDGPGYAQHRVSWDEVLTLIEQQQIVNRVMLRSTIHGFAIDDDYYEKYLDDNLAARDAARKVLVEHDIRPGQGIDLVTLLQKRGELPEPWPLTPAKRLKADKDSLARIGSHPLVQAYRTEYDVTKNLRDYLDKLHSFAASDGRVHPQVGVLGASATGRMSAGSPPVQQFPDSGRQMILADDSGGWVSIDFTAVEPLVAADAAGETDLAYAIRSDGDAYVPVGKLAGLIPPDVPTAEGKEHPGRKPSKVVLLGLLYGKGRELLASELGRSVEEAEQIKRAILDGVPAIGRWMNDLERAGSRFGYAITAAGRILPVGYRNGRAAGYRAQNYFHQGSAYDCLAAALVEIHRQGMAGEVRIAMHDELVVTSAAAKDIERIMQRAVGPMERFTGRTGLWLPTDSHDLPERWMKV